MHMHYSEAREHILSQQAKTSRMDSHLEKKSSDRDEYIHEPDDLLERVCVFLFVLTSERLYIYQ